MFDAMNDYESACKWVTDNVDEISGDFASAKSYLGHLIQSVRAAVPFLREQCVREVEEIINIAICTVNVQNALVHSNVQDPILQNVLRLNLSTTTQLLLLWMSDHGFEFEDEDTAQPMPNTARKGLH